MTDPVIAIVGPTASGKTALSIEVAQRLGGPETVEIISADAMQLYRGMDIGTAKISADERRGIVHHQIDVLDISEPASVAAYQKHARADVEAIHSRGRIPLVVGGSGLYISALLDVLDFPGTDPQIRGELEEIWHSEGLGKLITELREKDPVSADTINLANPRRVIRALEVVRLTGESYTPKFPRHTNHYPNTTVFGVSREMGELTEAITDRAQAMFDDGLLDEVRGLLDQGLRESVTASKATGYREAIAVLDGETTIEEAVRDVAFWTRRLAKKQRTWFRPDPRISWYDLTGAQDDSQIIGRTADAIIASLAPSFNL